MFFPELLTRGGLILLIALVVDPLLRHRASARHVLLTSVLCVLLLQPAQVLFGIAWRPAVLPANVPLPETSFEPNLPASSIVVEQSAAPAVTDSGIRPLAA